MKIKELFEVSDEKFGRKTRRKSSGYMTEPIAKSMFILQSTTGILFISKKDIFKSIFIPDAGNAFDGSIH